MGWSIRKVSPVDPRMDHLVKAMFQMAWADGEVTADEARALLRLLRGLGFSFSQAICLLDTYLTHRPDDAPVQLDQLYPDRRDQLEVVQMLVAVCFSDGKLAPEEVEYLEGLVLRVGINADELDVMRIRAVEALG